MQKILVTGGAGFIGSQLCKQLLELGHQVICVDNLFTGRKENLAGILDHANFKFIQNDINSKLDFQVDQIYNLACPASPIHYQFNPVQTIKTCVQGAMNMLDMATNSQAKILQASTSEIYGDPEIHPQTEDYWGNVNPTGLRSCYDEGKRCAETLFFDYHRQYGVEIKVARIFNTYGPGMRLDDGRVVSNFIVQALQNHPITIYGEGLQSRSFCYVVDMVDGLIRLMNSPRDFTGPVNLGNPHEITMLDLAETIRDLCSSSSTIVYKDLPSDDPRKRKPDISRANKYLGWQPTTDLVSGLRSTIEFFDDQLQAKNCLDRRTQSKQEQ